MKTLDIPAIQEKHFSNFIQRIAKKDRTAIVDCLDTYGNFIWALAKRFTNSTEDAERATQEIFIDIWQYAGCRDKIFSDDKTLILLIARRRLIKYIKDSDKIY